MCGSIHLPGREEIYWWNAIDLLHFTYVQLIRLYENPDFEGAGIRNGKRIRNYKASNSVIDVLDVTVFNDIRERLTRVTPEQIEAAGRRLNKERGRRLPVIGVVEKASTRALWTLSQLLAADALLLMAKARLAVDEEEEAESMSQAAILDMFKECVREIYWAQAKLDLGFHESNVSVGMQENWELCKAQNEPPAGLIAAIRGRLEPEL